MNRSWTSAELMIVRANYPQQSAKYCATLLVGRSWVAVEHAARRYGIYKATGARWSEKELKILRSNYHKLGARACVAILPGRTIGGIHHAARRCHFRTATIPGNARDPWLYSAARETFRRAHAETGCRVRLVIPERGVHYLTTQHRGGLLLDAVPHTVGFYAASCTVAQIREDIAKHLTESKVAA